MRAHQNTWGRVSQAWKLGCGINKLVCVAIRIVRFDWWGCQQMCR